MKKWFFILLTLIACKKFEPPSEREPVGIGAPNAFVLETRYVSHSGNELFLQMDVGVVTGGNSRDDLYIGDTAFRNIPLNSSDLEILSVSRVNLNENESNSTLLLMDATSDWSGMDNFNLRLRAMNKTMLEIKENNSNEMGIASFARDGNFSGAAVAWIWESGNAYTQTAEELAKIIVGVSTDMAGSSSYYDALDLMLEYANTNSNHTNKNITIVSLGQPDSQNSVSINQIISKANSYNIKINQIVLATPNNFAMCTISARTGGFMNVISSTPHQTMINGDIMDKGTPIIASIGRIVSKNLHVYRLNIKLIKNSGTWNSGSIVNEKYEILERYTDGSIYVNNYLPFYVQIP